MGQQQLLLLVLSTVIVGLATVAGIQAFDENQSQAQMDALTQRATSIAADIKAAEAKPAQLGGVVIGSKTKTNDDGDEVDVPKSTADEIAGAIGLSNATPSVEGAGENGECTIATASSGAEVTVTCSSDDAQRDVQATFDPDASEDEISTEFSTDGSFTEGSS